MKRIFKLALMPVLFLAALSCSDDDSLTVASPVGAPVLISPEDGSSVVLTEGLESNNAVTLVWNHGDYDVDTVMNYDVQMAPAGGEFVSIGATQNRVFSLTVGTLNVLTVNAGLTPFEQGSVQFRVVSSLGDNDDLPMVSNLITLNVTPFEAAEPVIPQLFLVGAVQSYYGLGGWDNTTAMPLRYIGDGTTLVFEGYVKVAPGDGFKFIGQQGSWDNGNYGTIGGAQDGNIENSGGSGDIKVAETDGPGLYYVQVDIDAMTYKSVKMNWGIIGSATAGQWNDETAMTYDFDTNTFSLTATVSAGEMKFRSGNTGNFIYSDAWKFNVGNSDPMVTYNAAAGNFNVSAGSHDFTLMIDLVGNATVGGL